MRITATVVCFLSGLVCGCGLGSNQPPKPPKPVNATIGYHGKSDLSGGDTVIVARCRGADEYAKRPRDRNWVNHWYLVTYDVLNVERGAWVEKELRFVFVDSWPTPESGIMVDKAPFPFAPGRVSAFSLKTSVAPASIVAREERSLLAPYGQKVAVARDAEFGRIVEAVQAFQEKEMIAARGVLDVHEETPDAYIVLYRTGWGTDTKFRIYQVEKETYAVSRIP